MCCEMHRSLWTIAVVTISNQKSASLAAGQQLVKLAHCVAHVDVRSQAEHPNTRTGLLGIQPQSIPDLSIGSLTGRCEWTGPTHMQAAGPHSSIKHIHAFACSFAHEQAFDLGSGSSQLCCLQGCLLP